MLISPTWLSPKSSISILLCSNSLSWCWCKNKLEIGVSAEQIMRTWTGRRGTGSDATLRLKENSRKIKMCLSHKELASLLLKSSVFFFRVVFSELVIWKPCTTSQYISAYLRPRCDTDRRGFVQGSPGPWQPQPGSSGLTPVLLFLQLRSGCHRPLQNLCWKIPTTRLLRGRAFGVMMVSQRSA